MIKLTNYADVFARVLLIHNTFPMIVYSNLNLVVIGYYKWRGFD